MKWNFSDTKLEEHPISYYEGMEWLNRLMYRITE
jgi:hypothetical protein